MSQISLVHFLVGGTKFQTQKVNKQTNNNNKQTNKQKTYVEENPKHVQILAAVPPPPPPRPL